MRFFRKKYHHETETTTLTQGDWNIPVKIIREMRMGARASISKVGATCRIPIQLDQADDKKTVDSLQKWILKQVEGSIELQKSFQPHIYRSEQNLEVQGRLSTINTLYKDRKSGTAKRLSKNQIQLILPVGQPQANENLMVRKLISKEIAKDFILPIQDRVHELNDRYFKHEVQDIRLRYNRSNWGSCSNTGNISLSTRLLLAPQDVIDYVIVHELAHISEFNHSDNFWSLVEDALPNYKQQVHWLKTKGKDCDF